MNVCLPHFESCVQLECLRQAWHKSGSPQNSVLELCQSNGGGHCVSRKERTGTFEEVSQHVIPPKQMVTAKYYCNPRHFRWQFNFSIFGITCQAPKLKGNWHGKDRIFLQFWFLLHTFTPRKFEYMWHGGTGAWLQDAAILKRIMSACFTFQLTTRCRRNGWLESNKREISGKVLVHTWSCEVFISSQRVLNGGMALLQTLGIRQRQD